MFVHVPGRKLLLAANSGHGFITSEDDAIAMTKAGKRVMNVKEGSTAVVARPAQGDQVAGWARTTSSLSSPSPKCRRWRAARAYSFSATRIAAWQTPLHSIGKGSYGRKRPKFPAI